MESGRTAERQRFGSNQTGGGGGLLVEVSRRAAPTAGGYRFDEETVAEKIREFEDLRELIHSKRHELIQAIRAADPPSHDPPAVAQAMATRASIAQAAAHNKAMVDYVRGYIDALRRASGTYAADDDEAGDVLSGVDGPSGTGTLFR
ncbi:hypothetical protein SAMN05216266_103357 [Amycolatopsis marina]|uniref:PE family protein n=1 Tax=Amycolatopsis marina TaxID=490629 RepID=A0A1I0XN51_9PSEU|nr:hypothetical protein SAMN05216266_103357 [Amycolatopsis marina]